MIEARAHAPQLRQLLLPRRPHLTSHVHPHTATHPLFSSRPCRKFTTSASRYEQQYHRKESFSSRLRAALGQTQIKWYPIPVGLGIGFLGFTQLYKAQQREKARLEEERLEAEGGGGEQEPGKPKKRKRIRPSGPWYVLCKGMYAGRQTSLTARVGRFRSCRPCL